MINDKKVRGRPQRRAIGVLFNSNASSHQELIIAGIDESAAALDLDLFCFNAAVCDEYGNGDRAKNYFYDLANKRTVEGLIILRDFFNGGTTQGKEQVKKRFHPLPLVTVEFALPGVPAVVSNPKKGMQSLIDHLIKVHGHRQIALLADPCDHALRREYIEYYGAALRRHKIRVQKN